jgi:hypothetical protein
MKHAGVCVQHTHCNDYMTLPLEVFAKCRKCLRRGVGCSLRVTAADVIQNRKKRREKREEEEQVGFTFIESRVCSTAS